MEHPAFSIVAEYYSLYIAIGFQGCSHKRKVFPFETSTPRLTEHLASWMVSKLAAASKMPPRNLSLLKWAG